MARAKKKILCILGLAVLAATAFLYLPISSLEPARVDAEAVAVHEARAAEHFEKILAGRNLDRPFPPMPERPENPTTAAKVELGRLLYFDPLLSGDNDVSCAHCHHPDLGLSDNRGRSMGRGGRGLGREREGGAVLRRGSPTVWNAAYNHLQFWDGRARDLEEQAEKPIQDPSEMAQDPAELEQELAAIPEYERLFTRAFGNGNGNGGKQAVSFEHVSFAIAAFERTLLSQVSRFVGQSKSIVVRGNRAFGNVTGIEIENSVDAVVEDNDVTDNAGGILVFALPNVPSKVARNCRVIGNRVVANNHENFADPTAIVAGVPSGTGIMILAVDDVEVVPAEAMVAAGYDGADLLWDLSGYDNSWDQPGASRLPYSLPGKEWSGLRRRANDRLWRLLAVVTR